MVTPGVPERSLWPNKDSTRNIRTTTAMATTERYDADAVDADGDNSRLISLYDDFAMAGERERDAS